MRTIVDLPNELIGQLDQWAEREQLSRAEVVRRALSKAVAEQDIKKDFRQFFGLWTDLGPDIVPKDGLAWQRQLRDECD
jgi:metal-responsive CopG/Arc/MetJ family transcriptional regulator